MVVLAFTAAFWLELAMAWFLLSLDLRQRKKLFDIDCLTANQGPLNAEIRRKDEMRLAGGPIIRERAL